jgi:membrane dipeptidase
MTHLHPDRRTVLALTAAGASALASPAFAERDDPLRGALVINALGGLENPNAGLARDAAAAKAGKPPGPDLGPVDLSRPDVDDRAIADARASGQTAVNITLGYVAGPMEPFEYTIETIAVWDEIVRTRPHDLLKVYTASDILKAKAENKIGLIYGFQNALQVGTKPERIDVFADLGVRVVQLTYNPANTLGDGSMAPLNRGLTPLGRQVIERLNARCVMVDLSHSGEHTCLEAARASAQPISINHTGCRAVTDLPRNKTDAELRLVAERGGFVGIYFMPFLTIDRMATPDDVVAHLEHALNVCGEDHVGLGTDGGTTAIDDIEGYRAAAAKDVEDRAKAGIGAKGERPDIFPFVPELTGPDQFRKLARILRKRGHSQARIEKILGGNFLRYASDVWG